MRLVVIFAVVACLLNPLRVFSAVHWYHNSEFEQHGDAYILKAGHEGMFHSRQHPQGSLVTPKRAGETHGTLRILQATASDVNCVLGENLLNFLNSVTCRHE
jgi:hypothetical protein